MFAASKDRALTFGGLLQRMFYRFRMAVMEIVAHAIQTCHDVCAHVL